MRKYTLSFTIILILLSACSTVELDEPEVQNQSALYLQNRKPLVQKPYLELPLGSIKPTSWLNDQLVRMKDGLTGHLDRFYPEVVGQRNGWLGGDGDGWERGPYWIDGLLPLAYILDDQELKDKVQPWVEWTLNNQREDGYLGPIPFESEPENEPGLQRGKRRDWWPKMVMLKILKQHYDATGDERVIDVLTKYFKFQLKELPGTPLDNWTFWANRRGADNLMVIYWLYNITGDDYLLELGKLINEQTFPWAQVFLNEPTENSFETPWKFNRLKGYPFDQSEINAISLSNLGGIHCVNFAQGLKQPLVFYQQSPEPKFLEATKKALSDIKKYHGQAQGMYGGDEPLHGNNPVQGIEFCSISEEMFSLETILTITGDMSYADQLEKITYNALPAQASDDFMSRQYFQAANQIEVSDRISTSYQTVVHNGTDFVFGILSGYPCCTTNMHQSWPKYVQNLWYATADGGVAALLYGPSKVSLLVADSVKLSVIEETGFPFRDEINFTMGLERSAKFPFHLRIPSWCSKPSVIINGKVAETKIANQVAVIDRVWADGDVVKLKLPMKLKRSQWYDFSAAIERGPLVYALKVETREEIDSKEHYGEYRELYAASDWNYALFSDDLNEIENSVEVELKDWNGAYPWNHENAPIVLKARGIKLPDWKAVNGAPVFPAWWGGRQAKDSMFEDITLVPYGCTELRITQFPVYGLR